jgi:predicted  nucleic acid-binding Zn-ribbon protein
MGKTRAAFGVVLRAGSNGYASGVVVNSGQACQGCSMHIQQLPSMHYAKHSACRSTHSVQCDLQEPDTAL